MTFVRQLIFASILTVFYFYSVGQSCFCISGTKDKKKGIETVGGVTNSKDYYSLLIQKQINYTDTSIAPKYLLFLNAASRVLLSDSMLKTFGTFELKLLDNTVITLDSVIFQNNPLGFCCTIGFQCSVTEEIIKTLSINPIVTITVKGILSTPFSPKRQREQQKIINCLISRH